VMFLEDILRGKYGNVVRAKGNIDTGNGLLRFDVAGGQYCISGADEEKEAKAVFIGKGVHTKILCEVLNAREAGSQSFTLEPFAG